MRKLILLLLTLFSSLSFSQFLKFEKQEKFGLKNGSNILLKPKFDSIIIADHSIATAFKKNKAFYINKLGKKVYQGRVSEVSSFKHGAGIVKNKKGEIGAVGRSGAYFIAPSKTLQISYVNQLIYAVDTGIIESYRLYQGSRMLEKDIKDVEVFDDWVLAKKYKTKTSFRRVKSGIFRKIKEVEELTTTYWKKVYDGKTGRVIDSSIDSIYRYDDMVVFQKYTKSDLYFNGNKVVESLTQIKSKSDAFYQGKQTNNLFLMDKSSKEIVVSGNHNDFKINPNTFHGIGHSLNSSRIFIYDLKGKLLQDQIDLVFDLADNRFVYADSIGHFIGDEFGDKLSAHYSGIGNESGGIRKVYYPYSYGYINDSTYQDLGINWPITGREMSGSSGRRRKGLIKSLGSDISNFGRRLIGKSAKNSNNGYSSTNEGKYMSILDDGYDFNEGMAIVCLNSLRRDGVYDTIYYTYPENAIYNYITTTGKLMNTKKYKKCLPFENGLAWVKYGEYYYRINKQGKTIKSTRYMDLECNQRGYYKVKKAGKWGLIDENYRQILPCNYPILTWKDGAYYSKTDGIEKMELRISE